MAKRSERRPYRGEHRARLGKLQIEATRGRILAAARNLFVREGYHGATIKEIAEAAGVAEPTVYMHFGSKQALVEAMMAEINSSQIGLEETYSRSSITEMLVTGFAVLRHHYELGADIERVIRDAARNGETLAVDTGADDAARRRHARLLVERLERARMLRKGLPRVHAADILALLSSLEVYESLVSQSGWKADEYERWLVEAANALLLEPRR